MSLFRVAASLLLAVVPSPLKVLLYRLIFRFQIGRDVKIRFGTALVGLKGCRIGDHVRIGPLNLFVHVDRLEIADHVQIGWMNLFRGGRKIRIGAKAVILRLNVLNSIVRAHAVNPRRPVLELGPGVVITTGHWLDFTDRIRIGANTVIGGRNSSFWTHNRQRTREIVLGSGCYVGSDVRVAPGVEIPACCVVALGSVLTGRFGQAGSLIAGNPARVLRSLGERDRFLVGRRTWGVGSHERATA